MYTHSNFLGTTWSSTRLFEFITKHHAVEYCDLMTLLDEPKIRGKIYGPKAFIYPATHE